MHSDLRGVILAACLYVLGCVSVHGDEKLQSPSQPTASEEALSVPLLVEQVISVKGMAKLADVHGVCYIVRDETGSFNPAAGQLLRDGDLLDLGNDCTLTIRSSAQSDVVLRRENGRFFRVKIKK